MIQVRHHPQVDLVVHTVTGQLEEDEFRSAVIALYERDPPARLSLWDLSDASVLEHSLDGIEAAQSDLAAKVRGRTEGKTAVVAPNDFVFARGRQYVALAESFDLPFEHRIFRTLDEACAWLGISADLLETAESGGP